MQKYGYINEAGELVTSERRVLDKYKPVEYAPIPDFDQQTQYVIQTEPVDMGEYIYHGVEVRDMAIDEQETEI